MSRFNTGSLKFKILKFNNERLINIKEVRS